MSHSSDKITSPFNTWTPSNLSRLILLYWELDLGRLDVVAGPRFQKGGKIRIVIENEEVEKIQRIFEIFFQSKVREDGEFFLEKSRNIWRKMAGRKGAQSSATFCRTLLPRLDNIFKFCFLILFAKRWKLKTFFFFGFVTFMKFQKKERKKLYHFWNFSS